MPKQSSELLLTEKICHKVSSCPCGPPFQEKQLKFWAKSQRERWTHQRLSIALGSCDLTGAPQTATVLPFTHESKYSPTLLCSGSVTKWKVWQTPQENHAEGSSSHTAALHPRPEVQPSVYILQRGALPGKKLRETLEAEFVGALQSHLGCLVPLHFITLIFIMVWWGVVWGICVFPAQSKTSVQVKVGKGVTDKFTGVYKSQ